jgi:hypothetical protein
MLVRKGDSALVEARAKAEPSDNMITGDYYAQMSRIRLSVDASGRYEHADTSTEVILDDTDVGRLVECAVKHPSPNMRSVVLAAIRNDADTFREIFRFGLNAPEAFLEIRKIVAEELDKCSAATTNAGKPEGASLLPRMPVPAHLRERTRKQP